MSRFKSILLPKSVWAIGQSLRCAFQKAAMASAEGEEIANDDEPWKISAFVSALMELFLSVLLLLNAAIAFITSQLVDYFGLEPPCTYIGCSHTVLPNSLKKRRLDRAKKYELCPDCRTSWGYAKRYDEKFLLTNDDTEISFLLEGNDTSADASSTSTSGVDVFHLDEVTYADFHGIKNSSSTSNIQNHKKPNKLHKKPNKLKDVKPRASNVTGNASEFINEDCIPLFSTRSNSVCSSISNAEDYCEMLPTSMDRCRILNLCQEKLLQQQTSTDDDASADSIKGISRGHNGEHHYALLEEDMDDEVYQDPFFESFEAVSGSEDMHGYMVLEEDDDHISDDGELHSESAQPLLSFVADTILEGGKLGSTSLAANEVGNANVVCGNHGPSSISKSAEGNNYCGISKESTCTNACEGEHHYLLLDGGDENTCVVPFFKELHSESEQPLPNGVSDDEIKVPNSFKMAPNMVVLLDSCRSSGVKESIEDTAYHELTEVIQSTAFEEQQHQYVLLEDDDEDSSEAPYYKNMPSDYAQPLLQGAHEGESVPPRPSLNFDCAKQAASAGDSHRRDIEQAAEDSAHCELPKTTRESTYMKEFITLDPMQDTEALLQGFPADYLDTFTTQGSRCVGPLRCDESSVKDHIECDNYLKMEDLNGPLADLLIVPCLEKNKVINNEHSLIDMESGITGFGDLLEGDRPEEIKSPEKDLRYSESGSQISVTEDALLSSMFGMGLRKQGCSSEENSVQEVLTGLCASDLEKLWFKEHSVPQGSQQQVVDQSDVFSKKLASNICSRNANLGQDFHLFQTRGKLEEVESIPSVCFMKNDANKVSAAAEGCSKRDVNANEGEDTGMVSNILFEMVIQEVAGQHDNSFESCDMKDRSVKAAEIKGVQLVNVGRYEGVLKVASQIIEQDKEEIQVNEGEGEGGLDALREALWAERNMLAALETELENERNAAAIATSEAMAMISRLQEEKSAMQLEVAQLQRMAEEKAEYDEQAMALLKEILFKRETEKHALEKEVDLYRERLLAEQGDMSKKAENKDLSMQSSTPLLLLRRTDEGRGPFPPKEWNDRSKNLLSWDEFYTPENTYSPGLCKEQNMAHEEHKERSPQFAKSPEPKSSRGFCVNDQVDTCFAEDRMGSASPLVGRLTELQHTHQELRGSSRSIFSTSDEETQFILERLWVLEEELRELRGVDGLGAQKNLHEVQYLDDSPMSKKSAGNIIDSCNVSKAEGHADENEIGVYLPVHDVYEVQSALSRHSHDIKMSGLLEDHESPEDLKSSSRDIIYEDLAFTMHRHNLQVINHTGRSLSSYETQCDSAVIANQDDSYADNEHAQLKTTEGGPVSVDVIQQLAMRLQVLETDRELLREVLESFRHRDTELKLLQEIAQQLRELRMVGFSSISTSGVLQAPMSGTFGKGCARAFKKRRYYSDSGQAEVILFHQRSI